MRILHETFHINYLSSPLGLLELVANDDFLLEINFVSKKRAPVNSNKILLHASDELKAYFKADLQNFSVPIHPNGSVFQKKVWNALLEIPFGHHISYKELADKIGNLPAIRAVANANSTNPIPILIPCHRVIGSDGSLTGYSGGLEKKRYLLEHEKVLKQLSIF